MIYETGETDETGEEFDSFKNSILIMVCSTTAFSPVSQGLTGLPPFPLSLKVAIRTGPTKSRLRSDLLARKKSNRNPTIRCAEPRPERKLRLAN
jgi:hypothetical protein